MFSCPPRLARYIAVRTRRSNRLRFAWVLTTPLFAVRSGPRGAMGWSSARPLGWLLPRGSRRRRRLCSPLARRLVRRRCRVVAFASFVGVALRKALHEFHAMELGLCHSGARVSMDASG